VTPAVSSIPNGYATQFLATGIYSDQTTNDLTSTATWAVSGTAAATITSSGLVTPTGTGAVTVTVASGDISGTATLTVTDAVMVNLVVTPSSITIPKNSGAPLTVTGVFSDGSTMNLTDQNANNNYVELISSDLNVAGDDTWGWLWTNNPGTAIVKARYGNLVSLPVTVTVKDANLIEATVTPATASINLGATQQFTVTGSFDDGTSMDMSTLVGWGITNPPKGGAGAVNNLGNGLFQGIESGDVTVFANTNLGQIKALLNIKPAPLVSIAVTPGTGKIGIGTGIQFQAIGTFADGSTGDLTYSVAWTSGTLGTATVGAANGWASSVAVGTTVITAKDTLSNITGSATLTVSTLSSLTVTPGTASAPGGEVVNFTATGGFSDGGTQDVTQFANWVAGATGDTGTASVLNGAATGLSVGTATITASLGALPNATATLTVGAILTASYYGSWYFTRVNDVFEAPNQSVTAFTDQTDPQGLSTTVIGENAASGKKITINYLGTANTVYYFGASGSSVNNNVTLTGYEAHYPYPLNYYTLISPNQISSITQVGLTAAPGGSVTGNYTLYQCASAWGCSWYGIPIQGSFTAPMADNNLGSKLNPAPANVQLTPGAGTALSQGINANSAAALGSNHYVTTLPANGTITITLQPAAGVDLNLAVYSESTFTTTQACAAGSLSAQGAGLKETCIITGLADAKYYFMVNQPAAATTLQTYTIAVTQPPVVKTLTAGTFAAPGTTSESITAKGEKFFSFQATGALMNIRLSGTASDLGWSLYSDTTFTTPAGGTGSTCDKSSLAVDEYCQAQGLTGGATYYLKVREYSGVAGNFNLTLIAP